MLVRLGQLSLGTAVPALNDQLASAAGRLADSITTTDADARALAAELASLSADLSSTVAAQLGVQATVTAAAAQLASLPGAALEGVQQAIAGILSGDALAGLQAAISSIPDTLEAGLEAAAAGPQAELAALTAQVATLQSRIADLEGRGAALAARLVALTEARVALDVQRADLLVGGIDAYVYAGSVSSFGAELDAGLGATYPGDPGLAGALVLVCELGPAWAALGRVLRVIP